MLTINALLDLVIGHWPAGGFMLLPPVAQYSDMDPPGGKQFHDERGWIGVWFERREDAVTYIEAVVARGSPCEDLVTDSIPVHGGRVKE